METAQPLVIPGFDLQVGPILVLLCIALMYVLISSRPSHLLSISRL